MRILVTGATGGLGRNAVECLHEQGVNVRATGRNVAVGKQLTKAGIRFIPMDLAEASDDDMAGLVHEVDAVWHCAALSAPWGSRQQFESCNVRATAHLLRACGAAGTGRFIHVSTPAIYFDYTHRLQIEESFRARRPANEYVRTKALAEALVQGSGESFPGMWTAIIRPRAIFGPHDQVLIPRLNRVIESRNGRLPLPRGGNAVIDMTYVENVVHAMWLATNSTDVPTGLAFNITNDEPARIATVLESLFVEQLGRTMDIIDVPYPVADLAARFMQGASLLTRKEPALTRYSAGVLAYDMTLSIRRARDLLGYIPPVSMHEGIRRTAAWMSHG
ncbi:MAG: NAD(P)-dependent oxidoreductase [Rhodocyclaceae bacterium]